MAPPGFAERWLLRFAQHPTPNTPALAAPTTPKIYPRTVGGPAMQAPTSERQDFRKNIPLFCDSIVGESIARPLKPCAAARPLGWSRAPPLPYTARECVKFLSPFRNSIVGAGLGSARVCRTLALAFRPAAYTEHSRPRRIRNPENTPPHRWRACHAGPYKQKASPTQKHTQPFLLYSRGEHCSPGFAERRPLRFAPHLHRTPRSLHRTPPPTPNTPAHTAAANPQLLIPHF